MISKKYIFMFVLILLVAGSVAYAGISGYSILNDSSDSEKDSLSGDDFWDNLNSMTNNAVGVSRGGSGGGSSLSGLASLVSIQNLDSPGIFLFQGFIGDNFEFSIEPANVENETEQSGLEYRVEFFDAENNLLKNFNFSVEEIEYSEYKMFYFFAEVPLDTGRIVFYDNSEMMGEFVISEHSPIVSNVEVKETDEDEFEISWEAEDADEDNLVFSVIISDENDSYIVGDLIKDNFFIFNAGFVPGGNYGVIVRAFDGFNFGYGEGDILSVDEKKPYLMIFGVANNSEIIPGKEIYASALGFDLEDGFLEDFSWRLNGEEISSEKSIVLFDLPLGEYELTLEAEDSDENFGEENIQFFVVQRVKFRTSNPSYGAGTKISVNLNCDSEGLEVYSTKMWVVGQKSCGELYDEPEYLAIEDIPYSGGMFGGLWECSSPLDLYEYSGGYYVCCMDSNDNSLMRSFIVSENRTETSDPINCVRGNNWCGNADITRDGLIDANDYDVIDRNFLFRDNLGECAPSLGHCLDEVDLTREVLC